jgi:pyruvate kinase
MDIARVNCAHDDPAIWSRMIDHVRSTRRPNGHRPRVAMDLAGPKLRTGPLIRAHVWCGSRRDATVSASSRRRSCGSPPATPAVSPHGSRVVPVDDAAWLERRQPGDRLEFVDSRNAPALGRRRGPADGCMVTATQTAYVSSGLELVCAPGEDGDAVAVGVLPEVEQVHRVDTGDHVTLTRTLEPAAPTAAGSEHRIGCTLPEVFDQAKPGERVWLDDGKIGGVIVRVTSDEIDLRVTDVRPGGVNLKAGKGINFPDTDLRLDALTAKDLDDLDFVAPTPTWSTCPSCVTPPTSNNSRPSSTATTAADVGIVLKIENVAAFEHLPELLLTAMRSRKVGVMIARGDLAVEVGFERLAEVQEEILWACEAAHVPVIWATQVLDTLARTGQPSRAEITDAAMSERAECVMLNKGPHITDAIHTLDSILTRMQHHQHKKRSLLRRLQAWDRASSPSMPNSPSHQEARACARSRGRSVPCRL